MFPRASGRNPAQEDGASRHSAGLSLRGPALLARARCVVSGSTGLLSALPIPAPTIGLGPCGETPFPAPAFCKPAHVRTNTLVCTLHTCMRTPMCTPLCTRTHKHTSAEVSAEVGLWCVLGFLDLPQTAVCWRKVGTGQWGRLGACVAMSLPTSGHVTHPELRARDSMSLSPNSGLVTPSDLA